MKKSIVLSVAVVLFAMQGLCVYAQKSDEQNKEKEKQEQQELLRRQEEQLRMLQEAMKRNMEEQRKALEKTKEEFNRQAARERNFFYGARGTGIPGPPEQVSTLTITKHLKKGNGQKTYRFTIDSAVTEINLSVSGSCQNGLVTIRLYYPSGKLVNEVSFDSSEAINWRQSVRINKENAKKYTGEWKFIVTSKNADGSYSLSVSTY